MESSRFIQISENILIEYVYTSQTAPTTFNTGTYPIELMRDTQTKGTYLFNTDVDDSPAIPQLWTKQGNYRDKSAVTNNINRTQYVSLNTSIGVPYNDSVDFLTDTVDLQQTFSPALDVAYDTIRVHFVAGFNFTGYDGLVVEVLAPRRDGVMLNFASVNFDKLDTPTFSADPLLLADKLYATYIEWKIPSLFYANNLFDATVPNGLAYKITEGQGFLPTPPLTLRVSGIYQTIIENAYSFYEMQEINSVSILSRDIYDNLYAQVIQSTAGDYFELSGEVTGSTFNNFISQLNAERGNYVVFHEISVTEQVGTVFTQTSFQVISQTEKFDEPILFRPIIKNANSAVSFSINYVLRLYNKFDATQIIKNAKLTSFQTQQYGRQMVQLNLGVVPTVANVYNQIANDNGQQIVVGTETPADTNANTSEEIAEKLVVKTKYVTTFRDRLNVKAAISPVKIQTLTEETIPRPSFGTAINGKTGLLFNKTKKQ
tara:strand:+ start:109 stop:1569 length:1461 start_codon:yes stop_codon:yes gene_type:complete